MPDQFIEDYMRDTVAGLVAENERLRAALVQFVACCDTAPPTSLMIELGMACTVARRALSATNGDTPLNIGQEIGQKEAHDQTTS